MIMQLQLDIRESWGKKASKKITEEYEALAQRKFRYYTKDSHTLKGKNVSMGTKCNKGAN